MKDFDVISSSWKRLFGEFTCNPKSATKNSETIVRCNKQVGQRTDRNSRNIRDRLATKSLEKTTLLTDRAVQLSTAKTYVFSDSVLCMGRNSENPLSAWKEKVDCFMNSSQCRELDRIDGEPMEFEWTNFRGFTALQILAEIQNMMTETQCEPEQFPGRIILMSMHNRHCTERNSKRRIVYCEFPNCDRLFKKICAQTLVVSWAWIRKEIVRNSHVQAEWKMGSSR